MSNFKNQNKKDKMIEFLQSIINSRITRATHREIASWSITVFYLTVLIAVSKYIYENEYLTNSIICKIITIVSILLFCFIVLCFIHSQYGAQDLSRISHNIYIKKIFELINDDIQLTKKNCKIEDGKTIPKFIQDEIKNNKNSHSFSKIGPQVIYKWFCKKIIKKDTKMYKKINLIESSLYNLVIVPTFIIVILMLVNIFKMIFF